MACLAHVQEGAAAPVQAKSQKDVTKLILAAAKHRREHHKAPKVTVLQQQKEEVKNAEHKHHHGHKHRHGKTRGGELDAVVKTLKDVLKSMAEEATTDETAFKRFQVWCAKAVANFAEESKKADEAYNAVFVALKEKTAAVATTEKQVIVLNTGVEDVAQALDQAEQLRKKEAQEYAEEVQLNAESSALVGQAITRLGGNPGFLQMQSMAHRHKHKNKHQHGHKAGDPSGDYVVGILKGVKSRLVVNKKDLDREEDTKKQAHKDLTSTKEKQVKAMREEVITKTQLLATNKLALVEAQREHNVAKREYAMFKEMAGSAAENCAAKEKAYDARVADRAREKKALEGAIEALEDQFLFIQTSSNNKKKSESSLLASKQYITNIQKDWEKRDIFKDDVEIEKVDYNSTRLAKAVAEARDAMDRGLPTEWDLMNGRTEADFRTDADYAYSFVQTGMKPRNMLRIREGVRFLQHKGKSKGAMDGAADAVRALKDALNKHQAEDDKMYKYCKDMNREAQRNKKAAEEVKSRIAARKKYLEDAIEGTDTAVAALKAAAKLFGKRIEDAEKVRKDEVKAYNTATEARNLKIRVVERAKEILESFYKSQEGLFLQEMDARAKQNMLKSGVASLLQTVKTKEEPEVETGNARSGTGNSVITLLDNIISRSQKEQKSADKEDKAAQFAMDSLRTQNKRSHGSKMEAVAMKLEEDAKNRLELVQVQEDYQRQEASIKVADEQLKILEKDCAKILETYQEETDARTLKISQLNEVVGMLR
eukprot:TRINITY_DN93327_c0_g1_i1.p1 TRINITY_DN93327_c0_g1~~TRINITY_DN93327_c0_g1_i1.p1  ORF type:complete len:827 (+),score=231.81 TRINITY_DN93327_c0_g1_i1:181-2481(+)